MDGAVDLMSDSSDEPRGLANRSTGGLLTSAGSIDAALRVAGALKSARGLLPESLKTEGEILAVILAGQELGLPPMASLRGLQLVRGKVIISYDTMIALLRRAGYRVQWLHSDDELATVRLIDRSGDQFDSSFSAADAKKAGLWGQATWAKYPKVMLRARAVANGARAFAGDVLSGVYSEDEGVEIAESKPRVRFTEPAKKLEEPQAVAVIDKETGEVISTSLVARFGTNAGKPLDGAKPSSLAAYRDKYFHELTKVEIDAIDEIIEDKMRALAESDCVNLDSDPFDGPE